jgi:uncharacterized protein HemX
MDETVKTNKVETKMDTSRSDNPAPVVEKMPAENTQSSTSTTTTTTIVQPKPKHKRGSKFLSGCILAIVLTLALVLIGAYIGATGYPKVQNWLQEHHFTSTSQSTTNSNGTFINNVTLGSEESVITNVVKNNQASVVSIAISQSKLTPGQGVVNTSNEIGTGFIVDSTGYIVTNHDS